MISSQAVHHCAAVLLFATLATQLFACVADTRGIEVHVAYRADAVPNTLRSDLGYRIALSEVFLTVDSLELIACAEANESALQIVQALWPFYASTAHAHSATTPTRLGQPWVFDVVHAGGLPQLAGVLRPAPNRYCSASVNLGPPDLDAEGIADLQLALLEAGAEQIMDSTVMPSVWIRGTATHSGGTEPFEVFAVLPMQVQIDFAKPLVLESALQRLRVSADVDLFACFDGVDFHGDHMDADVLHDAVIGNLQQSLSLAAEALP